MELAAVQRRALDVPNAQDPADAHEAASRGIATPSAALPFAGTIQRAFGHHDISSVQSHTGPEAAASARAMGGEAYASGDHVVLDRADLHTAAHEAAHVVQQRGGVQLKGGVGAAGDAYERHADAVADRVVVGRSAEDLLDSAPSGGTTHAVQRKEAANDAQLLDNQAKLKGTDVEIPALEGALLATRQEAFKRGLLSRASYYAGLALSRTMTELQPAVAAGGPVDGGLQNQAAVAAHQLFNALQKETAGDESFDTLPSESNGGVVSSQNRYTQEMRVRTGFLFWSSAENIGSWLQQLPDLIRQSKWADAFRGYRELLNGLDLWIADQLGKTGNPADKALGNAQEHNAQLRTGLEQIAEKHATRLPALFHPDAKTVEKEKAAGRPAADTIPMNVYFWKDAGDGKFHLYDLTTPGRPHEQTVEGPLTAAALNTFFEEVARYPEGEVRYTPPDGGAGVAPTTGKTKWYEWGAYAGLAIAAIGVALLTGGASVPATVCFAAGAVAGGVSAAGHLADSVHLGTATTATVVLDLAQVAASFASLGAMNISVKAGGAAAAAAGSRWFVPLVGATAVSDGVQFVALTDITYVEMTKIEQGAGSREDKARASAILVTQLLVTTGLTAFSVRGARDVHALAGKPLEIIEENGTLVLRVVGDETADLAANAEAIAKKNIHSEDDHHGGSSEAKTAPLEDDSAANTSRSSTSKGKEPKPTSEHDAHASDTRTSNPVVRKPASRHTLKKVTQTSVAKALNTVIEPRVDVAADIEAINAGKAVAGVTPEGVRTYTVNGRIYGVEPGGTLYPMTGDGFIRLNRNAYKVLGIYNKFGDTPRAKEIIELQRPSARFTDADIEDGLRAWQTGQGGAE